ncbi:hypothetical protein DAPPUDRAFT_340632, partial [Daphnia pulex]
MGHKSLNYLNEDEDPLAGGNGTPTHPPQEPLAKRARREERVQRDSESEEKSTTNSLKAWLKVVCYVLMSLSCQALALKISNFIPQ